MGVGITRILARGHDEGIDSVNKRERIIYERTFNIAIGANVRSAREKAKIEQSAFAKRLHISQSALSRIETGHQPVTLYRLCRIAMLLKILPTDLLPESVIE